MTAERLLQRLDKVRQTGRDRWMACCPAHDDKSPSLSIREMGDGRVLVHCFSGCSACEVLQAAGLEFSDLFPEPVTGHLPKVRKPWNASDVLHAIVFEAHVVWQLAKAMHSNKPLNDGEHARLLLCLTRLHRALEAING